MFYDKIIKHCKSILENCDKTLELWHTCIRNNADNAQLLPGQSATITKKKKVLISAYFSIIQSPTLKYSYLTVYLPLQSVTCLFFILLTKVTVRSMNTRPISNIIYYYPMLITVYDRVSAHPPVVINLVKVWGWALTRAWALAR